MTYALTLRKEAEFDISEHFDFYEGIRSDLGQDFLLCVEEALDKLQRNPYSYRTIHKELRRIPIRRFPYRVFYFISGEKVIVTAVFHVRTDPSSWNRGQTP